MYQLDYSDAILIYYLCCAKIVPALITFLADKFFNIKIKFRSLSLFNASIQNINIKWAGYEIAIGELCLKSKFINKEYKKPLCIDLDGLEFNQVCDENVSMHTKDHESSQQQYANTDSYEQLVDDNNDDNLKWRKIFRDRFLWLVAHYLPPTIMMTLKLFQIRIKNLSTTLLNRDKGPMISICIPSTELLFDGYLTRHNRKLSISLALQYIKSKFIAYNKQNPTEKPRDACLAEIVFDTCLKSEFVWENKQLIFESQSISLYDAQVTFYGGLFDIIEHVMLHTKGGLSSITNANANNELDCRSSSMKTNGSKQQSMDKIIDALTPHLISLNVQQIEIKSLDKHCSFHYHLLLQKFDAVGCLKKGNDVKVNGFNLRIYTPIQEVLFVKELKVKVNVQNENQVETVVMIDTIDITYNHEDIYGWFLKILTASLKSNRREMILKAIEIGNQRMIEFYHSEFVQNIFNQIVIHENIQLRHVNVLLELEDQISTINASKICLFLNQSNDKFREFLYNDYSMNLLFKNRHWDVEVTSDGTLSWFMGSKSPYSNTNDAVCSHVRGCALYLANSSTHISSDESKDAIKLNFRANKFRIEYSNKLTKFIEQSAKSYRSYVKLFSQMKRKEIRDDNRDNSCGSNENEDLNLEKMLEKISLTFEVVDFSSFFMNRHDVCIYTSLTSLSSVDDLSCLFDMLQVSTIDYRKYDGSSDLSDITTTYISTSLLKVNLDKTDQLQLCVDFAEKFECSWNAHFIRHLLSVGRDFHRFKESIADALEIEKGSKQISIPLSLPLGLDIKKLRNISVKHADVNIDKFMLLINEVSGGNLFFYNYFH